MNFSTAWLTTNRTCNNHCTWCYAKNTLGNSQIMDFENAKIAIKELKKRGVKRIILIGGEPTIYPNFIQIIRYIRSNNMLVSIATNGRMFKDMRFATEVLSAGITTIDISLKAFSEEEYKKNTNSYGLEEMLRGYSNLKQLGFKPSISYVLVNNREETIDNLINFLLEKDISQISLQFVKPILNLSGCELPMDLTEMSSLVEIIYNKMTNKKINYSIGIPFPLCLIDSNILTHLIRERRIFNCCHVPKGSGINIDENFKIIPCNHFAEFPFSDTPIDFSNEKALDNLYNTEIVQHFKNLSKCYPAKKCQTCNLWSQCGGGCFTYWLSLDPNDYIR